MYVLQSIQPIQDQIRHVVAGYMYKVLTFLILLELHEIHVIKSSTVSVVLGI